MSGGQTAHSGAVISKRYEQLSIFGGIRIPAAHLSQPLHIFQQPASGYARVHPLLATRQSKPASDNHLAPGHNPREIMAMCPAQACQCHLPVVFALSGTTGPLQCSLEDEGDLEPRTDEIERQAGRTTEWATVVHPRLSISLFFPPPLRASMKLRQQPEDFQVEELTDVAPTGEGAFALYRLEKRGWTTNDALQAVRRRWKLTRQRLSYGGLKDRHAHTVQCFTILRGPQRRLTHHEVHVEYLGQVAQPFTSRDIRANRFRITMRDMRAAEMERALEALPEVARHGVPNYFDDQRFGSAAGPDRFVARAIVLGDYERALRLALAEPYEHDRAAAKKEKAILRGSWGNWTRCREELPRGHARSLADYLAHHEGDYRGAVLRLKPELRGLYLSAYQSYLWNRMLALWLRSHCRPDQLLPVRLRLGEVPMYAHLDESQWAELSELQLPLPSGRMHFEADDPRAALMEKVLREEKVQGEQLKLRGLPDLFFSKGERAAVCLPMGLKWETADDEKNAGKEKLVLTFELPRGAYGTQVVKRISTENRTVTS